MGNICVCFTLILLDEMHGETCGKRQFGMVMKLIGVIGHSFIPLGSSTVEESCNQLLRH